MSCCFFNRFYSLNNLSHVQNIGSVHRPGNCERRRFVVDQLTIRAEETGAKNPVIESRCHEVGWAPHHQRAHCIGGIDLKISHVVPLFYALWGTATIPFGLAVR